MIDVEERRPLARRNQATQFLKNSIDLNQKKKNPTKKWKQFTYFSHRLTSASGSHQSVLCIYMLDIYKRFHV